jgi:hypothetical protein
MEWLTDRLRYFHHVSGESSPGVVAQFTLRAPPIRQVSLHCNNLQWRAGKLVSACVRIWGLCQAVSEPIEGRILCQAVSGSFLPSNPHYDQSPGKTGDFRAQALG